MSALCSLPHISPGVSAGSSCCSASLSALQLCWPCSPASLSPLWCGAAPVHDLGQEQGFQAQSWVTLALLGQLKSRLGCFGARQPMSICRNSLVFWTRHRLQKLFLAGSLQTLCMQALPAEPLLWAAWISEDRDKWHFALWKF